MSDSGGSAALVGGSPSAGSLRVRVGRDQTVDRARTALGDVYDPELGIDIVSLGLVYDVRQEAGNVVVEMTLTTPGCPVSESLPEMARCTVAEALGGETGVDVKVVWDPPWSPAMMAGDAGEKLGYRSR